MKDLSTRRDQCYFVARRAASLAPHEAAAAWAALAQHMDLMGELDVPKFRDLIEAVRAATIEGKQKNASNRIP